MKRSIATAAVIALGLILAPTAAGKAHTSQKVLEPGDSLEVKGKHVRIRNLVIRVTNPDGHGTYGDPWRITPSRRGGATRMDVQASDGESLAIRVGPHVGAVRVRKPPGWPFPCPGCTVIRVTIHWGR
jgi:hypothetical protein